MEIWSGEPFSYEGEHYRIEEMTFLPPPVQELRIPIWAVGAWPSEKSMRRALRYDGLLAYTTRPSARCGDGIAPGCCIRPIMSNFDEVGVRSRRSLPEPQ